MLQYMADSIEFSVLPLQNGLKYCGNLTIINFVVMSSVPLGNNVWRDVFSSPYQKASSSQGKRLRNQNNYEEPCQK